MAAASLLLLWRIAASVLITCLTAMKPKENLARSERKRDALVLIDVINDFDFPRAEALLGYALPPPNASPP